MAIAPPISFESSLNYVGLVVRVPPNSGIENVTIIPETSNDWNQLQQANKTIEMMHGTWNFVNESKATESGKFVFDAINFKQIFYNGFTCDRHIRPTLLLQPWIKAILL